MIIIIQHLIRFQLILSFYFKLAIEQCFYMWVPFSSVLTKTHKDTHKCSVMRQLRQGRRKEQEKWMWTIEVSNLFGQICLANVLRRKTHSTCLLVLKVYSFQFRLFHNTIAEPSRVEHSFKYIQHFWKMLTPWKHKHSFIHFIFSSLSVQLSSESWWILIGGNE